MTGPMFPELYGDSTRPATVSVAMDPLFTPAAWKSVAGEVEVELDDGTAIIPGALPIETDAVAQGILRRRANGAVV